MFEIFAMTDVGRMREHNEDAFLANHTVVVLGEWHGAIAEDDFIVAVADGVGGLNAGEIASRMCLTGLSRVELPISSEALDAHIKKINQDVYDYGKRFLDSANLGTTLVGMICTGERVTAFHVGDSRLYRYRDGILKQLTVDDSLVQVLFSSGKISREEMFTHPDKNIILQVIGQKNDNRALDTHIETIRGLFEEDDIYLLCSDGLYDMVPHEYMETLLGQPLTIPEMVRNLVFEADHRGGLDNITAVVVKRLPDINEEVLGR